MSALAQLMGSEKYSDLKLVCEGHEFRVHKAIVCSQPPVLTAACDGAFCCAQQTGVHEMVMEALLIAIYSTWVAS
jgi:hypothetical protein